MPVTHDVCLVLYHHEPWVTGYGNIRQFWLLRGDVKNLLTRITVLPVNLGLSRWVTLVYRTAIRLVFDKAPILSKLTSVKEGNFLVHSEHAIQLEEHVKRRFIQNISASGVDPATIDASAA